MQKLNLKKLKFSRPKINLSPETKKLFTWKELKAPLSVTFACIVAMLTSTLIDYFKPGLEYKIKTAAVLGTTLLIMGEMGTSEKFYLKSTLRVAGVLMGVSVGLLYALLEDMLLRHLEITPGKEAENPNGWVMIVFRVGLMAPTIFVCCLLMRMFGKYSYAINVLAIHVPAALLAPTTAASIGIGMAAGIAVVSAVLALVLFDKFTTESLLMETNKSCITGVLSVFQLAVSGDPDNLDQFLEHTDAIHKSISSAESAHDTYVQWRQWTCRHVKHDFKALVKPTRPLFYQAYSLYWGNVAAYHATEYRAVILFCNDAESFEKHFKSLVDEMIVSIDKIKEGFSRLYSDPSALNEEAMDLLFDEVITNWLWHGLLRAQEDMKRLYMKNRKTLFSTFGQRWNMTDYLRQIAMMTLALVDYMRAIVTVFQKPARQIRLNKLLDEVSDGLDELRREEQSSTMVYNRMGGDSATEFSIHKSTSVPNLAASTLGTIIEDQSSAVDGDHETSPLMGTSPSVRSSKYI
jgi:ribosome-associated toxin RatA of RatAB toxin-antitoxin module